MYTTQAAGTIIQNRYRILDILGQGGSGITYKAEDSSTRSYVALKELSLLGLSDWKKLELFEREAKILAKLNHPAIPKYLDYFQSDTTNNRFFYIAQELAEGRSLADLVAAGERFLEAEVRRIALETLQILQYLHGLNPPVIHRDIKPSNIVRHESGKIFLVDFGAVQTVYRETVAFGSTVVGTYGYMPPEQFRGKTYPATDLYGLGATLLHLLTHCDPGELPQQRLKYDFRSYVNISESFAQWLDGLLEPLAEDRFDSASTALLTLTNPHSTDIQPSNAIFHKQKPVRNSSQKSTGHSIGLIRNQHRLWIQTPLHGKLSHIRFLTLAFLFTIDALLLSISTITLPYMLMGEVTGWWVILLGICFICLLVSLYATTAILRMPSRKVSAFLDVQKATFTFLSDTHSKKVTGNIKDLKSIKISHTGNMNVKAITFKAKGKLYQFGAHLTDAEKKWIVSEIQIYLQEHKQLN